MQTVDEHPLETIHLYVVREEAIRPSIFPIVLSVVALSILVAVGVVFPYAQPEERRTLRIPAVFLPLKTFTTSVHIIPTGVKIIPATSAHGQLTIYNGSILSQRIPAGLILLAKSGIEVVVDASAVIPPGNPPSYGIASISAHALPVGTIGNIGSFAINNVYGTSLYIRNLHAFTGGKDRYSLKVETAQDIQIATDSAKISLTSQSAKIQGFLAYPCKELTQEKNGVLGLSWTCQYVTYSVPSYMTVTHVKLVEKLLFIDVTFVPRPRTIWFK